MKSKTQKSGDHNVAASIPVASAADVQDSTPITVTIKVGRTACSDSPWHLTVGEWRDKSESVNPAYNHMHLFRTKFNSDWDPVRNRVCDAAIRAVKELLGD